MATTIRPFRRTRGFVPVVLTVALLMASCTTSTDDTRRTAADGTAAAPTATDARIPAGAVAKSGPLLDGVVDAVMERTGVPGVAVAVVHDGEVALTKGYGVRVAGADDPVDENTVFQLASLSKPLGSTAVAGVVGRGDLAWDQPVVTELPEFRLGDAYVTENATVADFYSHRTGLPGAPAGNNLEAMGFSQQEVLQRLRFLPLGPFRAEFSYSNFGTTVGGLAAAAAAGTDFPQMAQDVLFGPAGMTSTSFRHADFAARDNATTLHVRRNGGFVTGFTRVPDKAAPAGGASSNAVDMAKWLLLQLDDGRLDGTQIIDAEALAETKRPHINAAPGADPAEPVREYGLGWQIGQSEVDPSLVEWWHDGAFPEGANTIARLYPELDLGIVVLTNAQPVGVPEAVVANYLDLLLDGQLSADWTDVWSERMAPLLAPTELPEIETPTAAKDDDAYLGTYRNDYFGVVVVRRGADGLELAQGPGAGSVVPLRHVDADVFLMLDTPAIEDFGAPAVFEFADGAATASTLVLGGTESGDPSQTLTRVR